MVLNYSSLDPFGLDHTVSSLVGSLAPGRTKIENELETLLCCFTLLVYGRQKNRIVPIDRLEE
jgi:hypothetical protein